MPVEPKTITVLLDPTPSGRKRAAHAVTLARRWDAHVIGVHVVFAGVTIPPSMCYVRGNSAIDQVIVDNRERDTVAEAASALLARHFAACCAEAGVSGEFRPVGRGRRAEQTVLDSLNTDLIVVGHPEPNGLPEDMSPERILMASGVPLLIVPNAWAGETIGEQALIGWNGSREARRAISDALPFLVAARRVTALVVDPSGHHPCHETPDGDFALHLVRHGVLADVAEVASRGAPIAQVILSYAVRSGSDLLVIGAYSHARLRELLLGGTTRTLLVKMPVPVLISR